MIYIGYHLLVEESGKDFGAIGEVGRVTEPKMRNKKSVDQRRNKKSINQSEGIVSAPMQITTMAYIIF